MKVYVLHRYWDSIDNEGYDIVGVYKSMSAARHNMTVDVQAIKAHYDPNFWTDDMTWENELEIHLGHDSMNGSPATIYCWEIKIVEVI